MGIKNKSDDDIRTLLTRNLARALEIKKTSLSAKCHDLIQDCALPKYLEYQKKQAAEYYGIEAKKLAVKVLFECLQNINISSGCVTREEKKKQALLILQGIFKGTKRTIEDPTETEPPAKKLKTQLPVENVRKYLQEGKIRSLLRYPPDVYPESIKKPLIALGQYLKYKNEYNALLRSDKWRTIQEKLASANVLNKYFSQNTIPKHKEVLKEYTRHWDVLINDYLRKYDYEEKKEFRKTNNPTLSEIKEKAETLQEAVNNYNLRRNLTVYRGFKAQGWPYKVGSVVRIFSNQFLSTSIDKNSAFDFADFPCCMLTIHLKKGDRVVPIMSGSKFEREKELLLPWGTEFLVKDIRKTKNDEEVVITAITVEIYKQAEVGEKPSPKMIDRSALDVVQDTTPLQIEETEDVDTVNSDLTYLFKKIAQSINVLLDKTNYADQKFVEKFTSESWKYLYLYHENDRPDLLFSFPNIDFKVRKHYLQFPYEEFGKKVLIRNLDALDDRDSDM